MSTTSLATPGQYVTFRVAGDEYGFPLRQVREIIEYQPITRVPHAPPSIVGVLNLRGSVVPVADLTRAFNLPESPLTRRTCVVIVEVLHDGELTALGVLVDSVRQVLELTAEEIRPPPSFGPRVRLDYLLGLGQSGKGFVLLLDGDRVLSLDELRGARSLETPGDGLAPAAGPP